MVVGLALMGFRVLTYDLYGRGYSDRPRGKQDRAFFIGQLEELLAHEEVREDVTFIGYSMGGAIVTAFAAKHVQMVRQLVLIAPAGMGVVAGGFVRFVARTPLIGDWLVLAFYPSMLRKGIQAEGVPDVGALQRRELDYQGFVPAVLASLRGILSARLETEHRKLHDTHVPVIAIWGREDDVIPLTAMGTLAEWSRNAHQEVIEGAGHGLTYTHSEAVLEAIRTELRVGF
jgi:pimeloyl-ACP methyl ester carboxylesterase